jgi:alcohol dehydrogenase (cytochrome c)
VGAAHVLQTIVSRIDGATGEVEVNPDTLFTRAGQTVFVCPTTNGGKNWEASAYSPLTNVMYVPLRNTCAQGTAVAESRKNTSLYGVAYKQAQVAPNSGGNVGTIYAISAETGVTAWKFEQRAGTMSVVATGGGLLFGGDVNGRFRAFDQRSGKCSGRSTSARPSRATPSPMRWTASSTSQCRPVCRSRKAGSAA